MSKREKLFAVIALNYRGLESFFFQRLCRKICGIGFSFSTSSTSLLLVVQTTMSATVYSVYVFILLIFSSKVKPYYKREKYLLQCRSSLVKDKQ
jgi:hypothetical protein